MSMMDCFEILNRAITGTTAEFTDPIFNERLARGEKAFFAMRLMQTAGTGSPSITVKLQRSNDNLNWNDKATIYSTLSFANVMNYAQDTGSNVGGCYARLSIQLAGTDPSAQVQIIVTIRED